MTGSLLVDWPHGLGDSVQLTVVLQHLKNAYPDLSVDVVSLRGKHSAFYGLCRNSYVHGDIFYGDYDHRVRLDWAECYEVFEQVPSTKASRCLKEVFHIEPKIKPYVINITEDSRAKATRYLGNFSRPVLIHYEGNTSTEYKNLKHFQVKKLCDHLLNDGFTPIILDWDFRSPLPDEKRIFCPNIHHEVWEATGTGDANMIAALCEQACLVVGIDSGPLHVAMATQTPTIGVWTRHHPIHYAEVSGNVVHLVPKHHASLIRGDQHQGERFFRTHYDFQTYDQLDTALINLVKERLEIEPESRLMYHI